MRNLLSANFLRLRKGRLFWGLLAGMFAYGLYKVIRGRLVRPDYEQMLILFDHAEYIGWFMAVFIPFFLGPEHTDNAIRNKVLGGHTRLSIYLSHLITTVLASFCFCAAYMLPVWGLGGVLLVPPNPIFTFSAQGEIAYIMLAILAMGMAFCAFYTAVILNDSHKAGALAACLLISLITRFLMGRLHAWLYNAYYGGLPDKTIWYPIGRFMLDFLPFGQANWLSRAPGHSDFMRLEPLLLMSLLFTAVSTTIGATLFRKKDLK